MIRSRVADTLVNPGIYAGLLFAMVALVLAYQARPTFDVPIGTATDARLLTSFYDPERAPVGSDLPYATYRWTHGPESSITFDSVGSGPFICVIEVNGTRPPGVPPASLRLSAAGTTLLDVQPPAAPIAYTVEVPTSLVQNGTLTVDLATNSFTPQGDARDLGIIVSLVRLAPAGGSSALTLPPAGVMSALVGAIGMLGVALAALGWGVGGMFAGAAALSVFAALLLVYDRLWLTSRSWYWAWPQALVFGIVLIALAWPIARAAFRAGGMPMAPGATRALLTLVLLVAAVRLAGQLHPSIFVYDLGFHNNILDMVRRGDLVFTTAPMEFGGTGHPTFYLPTPYLFIEPVRWLVSGGRLAIMLVTVAVGSLGAFPVYGLAASALRRPSTGVVAAALYLLMPISVVVFSWGITSNLFGEFFALLSLAVAVAARADLTPRRPQFWLLAALLMVTFLSHPGVLALSVVAFSAIKVLWFASRQSRRRAAFGLLGAMGVAAALAIVLYFRHFIPQMWESLARIGAERTGSSGDAAPLIVGGSVEDNSLGLFQRQVHSFGEWLQWGLRGFWAEAQAYYGVWPIVAATLGYISLKSKSTCAPLLKAAAGWSIAIGLLAFIGWLTNIYVRYALFALPVVAVGAGTLLAQLWKRPGYARWLTIVVVVLFAVQALVLWHYRINFAFKPAG